MYFTDNCCIRLIDSCFLSLSLSDVGPSMCHLNVPCIGLTMCCVGYIVLGHLYLVIGFTLPLVNKIPGLQDFATSFRAICITGASLCLAILRHSLVIIETLPCCHVTVLAVTVLAVTVLAHHCCHVTISTSLCCCHRAGMSLCCHLTVLARHH